VSDELMTEGSGDAGYDKTPTHMLKNAFVALRYQVSDVLCIRS